MSTALITTSQELARHASAELEDQQRVAKIFAASGYFSDARDLAQAFVKIQAGKELGFGPMASMSGIHVIEGKPSLGANIVAAAMKRHGYTWRFVQMDNAGCKLLIQYRGQDLGECSFLEEDAKQAELLNKGTWKKYKKSLFFARCITMAARMYAPEVFGGVAVYTAEELGHEADEDGAAVNAPGSVQAQQEVLKRKLAETEPATPAVAVATEKELSKPQLEAALVRLQNEYETRGQAELYLSILGSHSGEKGALPGTLGKVRACVKELEQILATFQKEEAA